MGRCLVVDDNAEFAENLAEILLDWCGEVMVANDGPQAIQLLGAQPFDLLVTDLKMPRMDGLQLVRSAQQMQPNLDLRDYHGLRVRWLSRTRSRGGLQRGSLQATVATRRAQKDG